MKILQINNCHYRRGGADAVYLNTAELLSSMGDEVVFFSTAAKENDITQNSRYFVQKIDFLELPTTDKILKTPRYLYSRETGKKLQYLLTSEKPDIAHIHLYKGDLTASILKVLKSNRIPTVITLHDYSLLCPRNILLDGENKICEKCIAGSPLNCLLKRCNRKSLSLSAVNTIEYIFNNYKFKPEQYFDKIIAPSKFLFNKHLHKSKLIDRLVHLYNFSPIVKNAIQNTVKGKYFLFYGRISQEKGIHTLLKTWINLPDTFNLKIVGTGPVLHEIADLVKHNKLNNVELVGYKSGEELKDLISNCSYVLVPSEWYENNPMTVIECYSYGKPVIVSEIGGLPEIVINEKTGYTFAMGDQDDLYRKLVKANSLSNEDYKVQSDEARAFALRNFSEKVHYESLSKIYRETIMNYNNQINEQ
jgi:glycosyltransferase involved in cell wall biosynthesis